MVYIVSSDYILGFTITKTETLLVTHAQYRTVTAVFARYKGDNC